MSDREGTHRLCVGVWRSFHKIVLDISPRFRVISFINVIKSAAPFNPTFAAMVSREICSTGVLQEKHTNTA
jgi:hypothetical protein